MYIGNFNDFMETVTPEVIEQIADDVNLKMEQMRQDTNPLDRAYLGNQLGMMSITISLEILGLYHRWLEQQQPD